uniref:Uncharacterized protein n=1 Tax=Anguilla anguilla TaxID=7936 RepID=A0A0E9WPC4_ANGAN
MSISDGITNYTMYTIPPQDKEKLKTMFIILNYISNTCTNKESQDGETHFSEFSFWTKTGDGKSHSNGCLCSPALSCSSDTQRLTRAKWPCEHAASLKQRKALG